MRFPLSSHALQAKMWFDVSWSTHVLGIKLIKNCPSVLRLPVD